jgi:hypothetical protein
VGLRNVTITLDEATARWARVEAAKRDLSLSRFLAELLDAARVSRGSYQRAMREYLAEEPRPLKDGPGGYPKREDLYRT